MSNCVSRWSQSSHSLLAVPFVLVAIFLWAAAPAQAGTYYVDSDPSHTTMNCACGTGDFSCGTATSPFLCIKDAVYSGSIVPENSEVIVRDGVYRECIRIGRNHLTIQAESSRGATIVYDPMSAQCGSQYGTVFWDAQNATLSGFKVTGYGGGWGINLFYPATSGYDFASGIGSPDFYNLARDLALS